ncbi:hypothetical protein D3C72_2017770 [compost metagenome]
MQSFFEFLILALNSLQIPYLQKYNSAYRPLDVRALLVCLNTYNSPLGILFHLKTDTIQNAYPDYQSQYSALVRPIHNHLIQNHTSQTYLPL